jgi:hypothetical protein
VAYQQLRTDGGKHQGNSEHCCRGGDLRRSAAGSRSVGSGSHSVEQDYVSTLPLMGEIGLPKNRVDASIRPVTGKPHLVGASGGLRRATRVGASQRPSTVNEICSGDQIRSKNLREKREAPPVSKEER